MSPRPAESTPALTGSKYPSVLQDERGWTCLAPGKHGSGERTNCCASEHKTVGVTVNKDSGNRMNVGDLSRAVRATRTKKRIREWRTREVLSTTSRAGLVVYVVERWGSPASQGRKNYPGRRGEIRRASTFEVLCVVLDCRCRMLGYWF